MATIVAKAQPDPEHREQGEDTAADGGVQISDRAC
ncbi:hypothetical protein Hmuk_0039 [Halomicrobium mukohataei DSM 12286]|uniref:Uncharacterized protein n=1 Tax=Halomicrobium mukohataei (strain ATCC 700874 / DSM 12286 / JCM 9738 / NCIMB 13541) TaxID=485914 RepID=C7NVS5_HALMD|nr:hypothetical protein Hmuk_0039 [Halomicrobium mukohataei DSM 12286]